MARKAWTSPRRRCQDDDSGLGKLAANGAYRIDAVHFRHLQVHQSDVWTQRTELLDRFTPFEASPINCMSS